MCHNAWKQELMPECHLNTCKKSLLTDLSTQFAKLKPEKMYNI